MNEPRPAMISARPPEIRSTCANCSKTRTGSSEESTITALESRICFVTAEIAAREVAAAHARERGRTSGRRRDEVVGAVMLSDGEALQAELVRERGFLQEVAHAFRGTETG